MIGKLIKFLAKTILWAVFIALVIPVGYFALRMGQPMDLPEYKGLTYYQYLEWEHLEQEQHLEEYHAKNPSVQGEKYEEINTCGIIAFAFGHTGRFFSQPVLMIEKTIMTNEPFDALHFLPNWWGRFETDHLKTLRANSTAHPICRIPSVIPDDYALSVGAQLPDIVKE